MSRLRAILTHARPRDWLLVLGTFSVAGLFVWLFLGSQTERTVYFVTGLVDTDLTLEVNGESFELDAMNPREARELPVGVHDVRVLQDGTVIDERVLVVQPHKDAIVFNVLGSAPVYRRRVVYARKQTDRDEGMPEFFGGKSWFDVSDADYVFTEPPSSISTKSSEEVRHAIAMLDGGWLATAEFLAGYGHDAQGSTRVVREQLVFRGAGKDDRMLEALQVILHEQGPVATLGMLRELLRRAPDSNRAQRLNQDVLVSLGETQLARAHYRELAARDPRPEHRLLEARIAAEPRAREILEELRTDLERSSLALRADGYFAEGTGDFERAARSFEALEEDDDADYQVESLVRAWVSLGRADDALARLEKAAKRTPEMSFAAAVTYARVEKLSGESTRAISLLRRAESEADPQQKKDAQVLVDVRSGLRDPTVELEKRVSDELKNSVRLERLAQAEPEQALLLAAREQPEQLEMIPDNTALLLACEAARLGREDLARRLLARRVALGVGSDDLLAFITAGREIDHLQRLDPDQQAALVFVRARALEAQGQAADLPYERARTRDPLGGPVARAIAQWRRPNDQASPP